MSLLLVVLLLPSGLPAQEPPRSQVPPGSSFPAQVEGVVVDAVVLDRRGDPVGGLTAEDFLVEEDGSPQTVTSFEPVAMAESREAVTPGTSRVSTNLAPAPPGPSRTFVIVFDNVHMAPERVGAAREAVMEFLATGLQPGDQVTLVPTSGGAWWSTNMPEGREDLVAALARLEGLRPRSMSIDRISDWEAMRLYLHRDQRVGAEVVRRYYEHRLILEPPGGTERAEAGLGEGHPLIRTKAAEVYQAALQRKRATLGSLERVAESLAPVKGRKAVILVSEGFVHEPTLTEFREVVRASRRANAAVYFIDARGLRGGPATFDAEIPETTDVRDLGSVLEQSILEAQGSDSIAIDTGGFSVKNRNDLGQGLLRIARESRSYYLIGYQPGNTKRDGKYRSISVKVPNRDDVEVRARKGYYALDEGKAAPRATLEGLDPDVRRSLDSPYLSHGITLRLSSLVLGPSGEGRAQVLLVAEADARAFAFQERGGRFEDIVESFVLVSSRDTGENQHQEKLIELSLPAEVKAQLEASWLPVMREFRLAPGVYQARLLLRDRNSGRSGTVRHQFEVPTLDALRTSTPVLTDVLQPRPAGSPVPPRPVPVARRTFAAGRTLYYLFEVMGRARTPPREGRGWPADTTWRPTTASRLRRSPCSRSSLVRPASSARCTSYPWRA
jgi:VWFA-related protein